MENILQEYLTNIADALRVKYDIQGLINPQNFSSIIDNSFTEERQLFATTVSSNASAGPEFTIPEGTPRIRAYVFAGCSSLVNVSIPSTVNFIGASAMSDCTNLANIFYNGTMTQWGDINKDSGWDSNTGSYTIHCNDGDISK